MKLPNGNYGMSEPTRDELFFQLASECPVEAWLQVLGHRWNALILYHLSQSPLRFSEFATVLPTLSSKVLTDRLAELSVRGLIAQSDDERKYRLTPGGIGLMPILNALEEWSRTAGDGRKPGIASLRM